MRSALVNVAGRVRRLLTTSSRSARAFRRWHRELGLSKEELRGITLLRQWLTPQQLAEYEADNFFEVTGCDSGKRYRIRYGTQSNICELDGGGRMTAGWCFVPDGGLTVGDVMLAQKIALETQETGALAVAKQFGPIRRFP
jgi:hypothetical protein